VCWFESWRRWPAPNARSSCGAPTIEAACGRAVDEHEAAEAHGAPQPDDLSLESDRTRSPDQ
jgi:hypothetical protein